MYLINIFFLVSIFQILGNCYDYLEWHYQKYHCVLFDKTSSYQHFRQLRLFIADKPPWQYIYSWFQLKYHLEYSLSASCLLC